MNSIFVLHKRRIRFVESLIQIMPYVEVHFCSIVSLRIDFPDRFDRPFKWKIDLVDVVYFKIIAREHAAAVEERSDELHLIIPSPASTPRSVERSRILDVIIRFVLVLRNAIPTIVYVERIDTYRPVVEVASASGASICDFGDFLVDAFRVGLRRVNIDIAVAIVWRAASRRGVCVRGCVRDCEKSQYGVGEGPDSLLVRSGLGTGTRPQYIFSGTDELLQHTPPVSLSTFLLSLLSLSDARERISSRYT